MLNVQMKALNLLSKNSRPSSSEDVMVPDAMALLSLPSSLRKTILALYKIGEATATHLSKETKRRRAVESAYANQLTRLGYLAKKRIGRKTYFYINHSRLED